MYVTHTITKDNRLYQLNDMYSMYISIIKLEIPSIRYQGSYKLDIIPFTSGIHGIILFVTTIVPRNWNELSSILVILLVCNQMPHIFKRL